MDEIFHSLTSISSKDTATHAKILVKRIEEMTTKVAPPEAQWLAKRVEAVLLEIASNIGVPLQEWDLDQWKEKCRIAFGIALEIMEDEGEKQHLIASLSIKQKQRRASDRNRIRNRSDQVTKRTFQVAARVNFDAYKTKEDAIRDLRIKPQFENHPDTTLRGWLSEMDIWIEKDNINRSARKKTNDTK